MTTSWPRATVTRRIRQVASDTDDLLSRISEVTDGQADSDLEARTVQAEASARYPDAERPSHAVLTRVTDAMSWFWSLIEQLLRGGAPAKWDGKKRKKRT